MLLVLYGAAAAYQYDKSDDGQLMNWDQNFLSSTLIVKFQDLYIDGSCKKSYGFKLIVLVFSRKSSQMKSSQMKSSQMMVIFLSRRSGLLGRAFGPDGCSLPTGP